MWQNAIVGKALPLAALIVMAPGLAKSQGGSMGSAESGTGASAPARREVEVPYGGGFGKGNCTAGSCELPIKVNCIDHKTKKLLRVVDYIEKGHCTIANGLVACRMDAISGSGSCGTGYKDVPGRSFSYWAKPPSKEQVSSEKGGKFSSGSTFKEFASRLRSNDQAAELSRRVEKVFEYDFSSKQLAQELAWRTDQATRAVREAADEMRRLGYSDDEMKDIYDRAAERASKITRKAFEGAADRWKGMARQTQRLRDAINATVDESVDSLKRNVDQVLQTGAGSDKK